VHQHQADQQRQAAGAQVLDVDPQTGEVAVQAQHERVA
jgi:hypothetical protein